MASNNRNGNNRRVNRRQSNNNQRQGTTRASQNNRRQQNTRRNKPQYVGCGICKSEHRIITCKKFLNLNLTQKYQKIIQLHYCSNCLARNHVLKDCTNQTRCNTCGQKHHSLLHGHQKVLKDIRTERSGQPKKRRTTRQPSLDQKPTTSSASTRTGLPSSVLRTLIPTAEVYVSSKDGCLPVRAILNPSLPTSRIAHSFVREHKLETFKLDGKVYVQLLFTPNMTSLRKYDRCMLVTNELPKNPYSRSFNSSIKDKFEHIALADPYFYSDAPIIMEIGGDMYTATLKTNTIHVDGGSLIAQDSTLGWLIMGSYSG